MDKVIGLDEAAEKYADDHFEIVTNVHEYNNACDLINGFKAGAEWQQNQHKQEDVPHQELFEEYKGLVSNYCIAVLDVPIRYNEDGGGYFFDCNLQDCCYIRAGDFTGNYVADELENYEFEGIDKEGFWNIEFLMKCYRGDENYPSYMEILLEERTFCMTFEEKEKQDKEILEFNTIFNTKAPIQSTTNKQ